MHDLPQLCWQATDQAGNQLTRCATWRSASKPLPPKQAQLADDTLKADAAFRLISVGTALIWQGDFHNAKQLLQAIARRIDANAQARAAHSTNLTETFHKQRQQQAQRTHLLGMLLIPFNADHSIPLRRAPDASEACSAVFGKVDQPYVLPLRELQGIIGAHEWRKKGVEIPVLNARIHPHHGVFSPIRGEYLQLVAEAPLPALLQQHSIAFDIGTGTGVLAAILAKRGIRHIIATDQHAQALQCAKENIAQLGYAKQVSIEAADMYPQGQAALIVCNPPWLPAKPSSALDAAIYDPESRMLRGFLQGLKAHLLPGGEGWLILSDLAELLGLRTRAQLQAWIDAAGLQVMGKMDTLPQHARATDHTDPLHAARSKETTSLWRLIATENSGKLSQ